MAGLTGILDRLAEYQTVLSSIQKNGSKTMVSGITESARAHFITELLLKTQKTGLVVVDNMMDARSLAEDLSMGFGRERVLLYAPKDYIFHHIEASDMQVVHGRLNVLREIRAGKSPMVVVTTIEAFMQYTLPAALWEEVTFAFRPGERYDLKILTQRLALMGYKRCDTVEGIGQFSIRGGILDIYSPAGDQPLRIEFFDDEVDTVRCFDPETQRSQPLTDEIQIICCREAVYDKEMAENVAAALEQMKHLNLSSDIRQDIEAFRQQHYFPAVDKYIPLLYQQLPTLFSYFGADDLIFLDYPNGLFDRCDTLMKEFHSQLAELIEHNKMPQLKGSYMLDSYDIAGLLKTKTVVCISGIHTQNEYIRPTCSVNITARNLQAYQGNMNLILEDMAYWYGKQYAVDVLVGTLSRAQTFAQTLLEHGISSTICEDGTPAEAGQVVLHEGSYSRGFEYPLLGHVFISSRELFGGQRKKVRKRKMKGERIRSYQDLEEGDYVVHQVHGIGRYLGINRIEVDGKIKDYLKIVYKGNDILYVPATQLDSINKYLGADATGVKLNKMGGNEFAKAKARVQKNAEDIAKQLVELYAQRQTTKGFAFAPDTDWQNAFEQAFEYEETEDQLSCIAEIKQDMESSKPMDRLLCGDVGFGKTEVAIRAAFKAVMENKQVAYLVPTTILAQQQYNTFQQRMKDYPIQIEMLCRFRTPKQQKQIVQKVANGSVNIIIGTHRLLQKDVSFQDLGLLIIDEEQRFGVKDKEKIKALKQNIDVLTLTATPIPRTLHMAMIGIRDMSVISNPPENRHPVQTFILEYDRDVLREAIQKELGRGGQVYYVHNRVEGIERIADEISKMVPEARIAVGHGKMSERELEEIMMDTLAGDIDILVCTTIIETGLDIPNINTIIIENADCMGLSQLYQLRGRVGRSNRLAYCYLTYRKDKSLQEVAVKRLMAIKEFTEFGSGFKIAMRDLEIRGAGNLLGAQQHGAMEAVGYDMYCNLLQKAIAQQQGKVVEEDIMTSIELNVNAYIPDEFIDSHALRIELYKRIASVTTLQDARDVTDEVIDRFGEPPVPVTHLIRIALLKHQASACGITDIMQRNDRLLFYLAPNCTLQPEKIKELAKTHLGKLLFSNGEKPYLTYLMQETNEEKILDTIAELLNSMK
ncbi:MAG: transcription-repair coupling factor [Clostridia bacterium]|nr:transcription-repair coupling factor [Clostridia bacterium]